MTQCAYLLHRPCCWLPAVLLCCCWGPANGLEFQACKRSNQQAASDGHIGGSIPTNVYGRSKENMVGAQKQQQQAVSCLHTAAAGVHSSLFSWGDQLGL